MIDSLRHARLLATLLLFTALQSLPALDWPQWRGPDRNDISKETGLLKEWPSGGPKRVWLFKEAGAGYAGISVVGDKLFTMGGRGPSEFLILLDAKEGKEVWSSKLGDFLHNEYGDGPRGTPTVDGDKVYALGGRGNLICAQVSDGKVLWQHSMQELGGKIPGWGYTESPLIDGNLVVCTPGGSKGAMVAFDKTTGAVVWQSKDFTDPAHYSSIVAADINGKRQFVQLTERDVVGSSPADGSVFWKSTWPGRVAVIPTPVVSENQVYVTSGYGVGCKLIKIDKDNQVSDVFQNRVMKNHHGGVVLVDGYIYGHSDQGWVCQNFKTGEEVWAERNKLAKGSLTCADGMFYCLDERGSVALIEVSNAGWKEHGRFKLNPLSNDRSPQGGVWTHPVVANGRLYLRDQELLFSFDVKK